MECTLEICRVTGQTDRRTDRQIAGGIGGQINERIELVDTGRRTNMCRYRRTDTARSDIVRSLPDMPGSKACFSCCIRRSDATVLTARANLPPADRRDPPRMDRKAA